MYYLHKYRVGNMHGVCTALLAKKVSLVPTPEGAEIRYAVLPDHINMLIFRSSQLDGEINAG